MVFLWKNDKAVYITRSIIMQMHVIEIKGADMTNGHVSCCSFLQKSRC